MRNKAFLVLAAVLILASSLLGGHFTASVVSAAKPPAKYRVSHGYLYGSEYVAVADGYMVEYRLRTNQWGNWISDLTDHGSSYSSCSPYGTYRWQYETPTLADAVVAVEFRATVTQGRAGTVCSNGASVSYCQTETLNKQTYPGGVATNLFGCYQ